MNLLDLFVRIGVKDEASGAISGLAGMMSSTLVQAAQAAITAVAAVGTAVAAVATTSVKSYAEYEQLAGGVETLFKGSSDIVKTYAQQAYKTQQISANEYMETVTSFSAALLQGLGGDTKAAAAYANTAITDMADNANKMGTSMDSVQNAYQGFAKQNYTMLDNLKLGYGGTAGEMARLINDSGVLGDTMTVTAKNVNDVSFAKIIEAIHVVQGELDITGTSANEASQTISGSVSAMGAAWDNLLAAMASPDLSVGTAAKALGETVITALGNIVPAATQAVTGIGEAIATLAPILGERLPGMIAEALPVVVDAVGSMAGAVAAAMPGVVQATAEVLPQITAAIFEFLPQLVEVGVMMITTLADAITTTLPTLMPIMVEGVTRFATAITQAMPVVMEAGIQIVKALAEGLISAIPIIVEALPALIEAMIAYITAQYPTVFNVFTSLLLAIVEALPMVIEQLTAALPALIEAIVTGLVQGEAALVQAAVMLFMAILQAIPVISIQIMSAMPQIIAGVINGLAAGVPQVLNTAVQLFMAIVQAAVQTVPQVVGVVKGFVSSIANTIKDGYSAVLAAGRNLMEGFAEGIRSAVSTLVEAAKSVVDTVIDTVNSALDIHSPSRVFKEIGYLMAAGLGVGWTEEMENINKDIAGELNYSAVTDGKKHESAERGGLTVNQYFYKERPQTAYEVGRETRNGLRRAGWELAT